MVAIKLKHLIISLFIFLFMPTFAQQSEVDSLIKTVIQDSNQYSIADTNQIITLIKLGNRNMRANPDTALMCYQKAFVIAKSINISKFVAQGYYSLV